MVLGGFLAFMNYLNLKKARTTATKFYAPLEFDCKHCSICKLVGETAEVAKLRPLFSGPAPAPSMDDGSRR